jgi:hypothetical protein
MEHYSKLYTVTKETKSSLRRDAVLKRCVEQCSKYGSQIRIIRFLSYMVLFSKQSTEFRQKDLFPSSDKKMERLKLIYVRQ